MNMNRLTICPKLIRVVQTYFDKIGIWIIKKTTN